MHPVIVNRGEGKAIAAGNSKLFLKLSSEAASNKLSITEYELSAKFPGPPAHKHRVFEHAWYVLEGELTVQLGNEISILTKGSFFFFSKTTVHAFSNQSNSVVKMLVVDTPGGFEHYYDDFAGCIWRWESYRPGSSTKHPVKIRYLSAGLCVVKYI